MGMGFRRKRICSTGRPAVHEFSAHAARRFISIEVISMKPYWWALLFGFVVVGLIELGVSLLRPPEAPEVNTDGGKVESSMAGRAHYLTVLATLVISPLASVRIAGAFPHLAGIGGILTVLAMYLFVVGILATSLARIGGKAALSQFVSNVERGSRTSFRTVARLWMLAIFFAAIAGAHRLALHQ